MHRIKQCLRTAFPFLIIILLSTCLVVWRLIKSLLEPKVKREEAEEVKSPSIADDKVSAVLPSHAEPEDKVMEAKVDVEEVEPAPIRDGGASAVLPSHTEPEDKVMEAKVDVEEVEPAPIGDSGASAVLPSNAEPEDKVMETKVDADDSSLVLEVTEAYCVKCRQKRAIQGAKKVTTKKGRPAIGGTCSVCGTKLFRFIAREKETLSEEG